MVICVDTSGLFSLYARTFAPRGDAGSERTGLKSILHESFFNATVLLLIGSLIIGVITGPTSGESLKPFMSGPFKRIVSVTFPFNISLGIPLYFSAISRLWG